MEERHRGKRQGTLVKDRRKTAKRDDRKRPKVKGNLKHPMFDWSKR